MNVPTAAGPSHYYVVGAGGSVVLKHGLQGFMQYMRILNYNRLQRPSLCPAASAGEF